SHSARAVKDCSTEGNTLTGLINLLASPIHPDKTVHRFFCIALPKSLRSCVAGAILVFASATLILAQGAPEGAQGVRPVKVPQPGETPPSKVTDPPPADPPAPPNAPATVRLQFPNSDVADVLHLYEQLTGKKLVLDNFVQGKVNIFISKDVPREEAIRIIEINLLMNGYSLVPSDNDIVKVIGTGKNP